MWAASVQFPVELHHKPALLDKLPVFSRENSREALAAYFCVTARNKTVDKVQSEFWFSQRTLAGFVIHLAFCMVM